MDSSKDKTVDQVVKINTTWRVQADDDVVFLQTKVPFVNETRFSAVSGILDPRTAYEVNVQLLWHLMEGDTTVRAGTPLCCYIPMSRRMLEDLDMSIDVAGPTDYKLEEEFIFTAFTISSLRMSIQLRDNLRLIKY